MIKTVKFINNLLTADRRLGTGYLADEFATAYETSCDTRVKQIHEKRFHDLFVDFFNLTADAA